MHEPRTPIANRLGYVGHAATIIVLGVFYMLSPAQWYGPSWSYFYTHGVPVIAAGGFGLGVCLTGLGLLQLMALWRDCARTLAALFFLSGFTFLTAGFILGAEGLIGHHGLQEAPLLIVIGLFKLLVMSNLIVRRQKDRQ